MSCYRDARLSAWYAAARGCIVCDELIRFTLADKDGMATKIVHFLRHGQAMHNPRAEAAKTAGCSYQKFLDLMQEDDVFDADLTEIGLQQAKKLNGAIASRLKPEEVELVAASTLSRAIDTADLVFPPDPSVPRLALDEWREVRGARAVSINTVPRICARHDDSLAAMQISGWLENARRRPRAELAGRNVAWDFRLVPTESDELWQAAKLEAEEAVALRGYAGLQRVWEHPAQNVVVAAHGGIFHYLFDTPGHALVRTDPGMRRRFGNCELVIAVLCTCIGTLRSCTVIPVSPYCSAPVSCRLWTKQASNPLSDWSRSNRFKQKQARHCCHSLPLLFLDFLLFFFFFFFFFLLVVGVALAVPASTVPTSVLLSMTFPFIAASTSLRDAPTGMSSFSVSAYALNLSCFSSGPRVLSRRTHPLPPEPEQRRASEWG